MKGNQMNINLLFFFFFIFNLTLHGQSFPRPLNSFELKKYHQEKEQILNVILNSAQFDSAYCSKKVYFGENEILNKNAPLNLKKKKGNVILVNDRDELKGKEYLVLGDFTMADINPVHVRVQLESLPQKTLLNFRLEKTEGDWRIVNYVIIKNE
jgi:hypothetical protein